MNLRTIRDLLKTRFGRDPLKYPSRKVLSLETEASPGVKRLKFAAKIQGTGVTHDTSIMFEGIGFNETPSILAQELISYRGKPMYHVKPSVDAHDVKLKCTCASSRFEFEYPMFRVKALIGNWRRYKRKTPPPPEGRPYKNPDNVPGYCLHVHSLLTALIKSGRVKQ